MSPDTTLPPTLPTAASSSSLKRRVYEVVEVMPADEAGAADGAPPRRRFDWFDRALAILIVLNVVAVVLETVPALERRYDRLFHWFEVFSVVVFSAEYLARLWSCTADPRYAHPVWGRLRFALRPMSIVDLVAILPTILYGLDLDLRFVRALRLLRLLRVLKMGRYSDSVGLLGDVLRSRRAELTVMFFALTVVLIVAAGAMYYAEHEEQPDAFSSIPASMWWAVVTLTTIGYGDVYPKTVLGKVLGGFIAVCGIGIVALPTAIIASGFAEELQNRRKKREKAKDLGEAGAKREPPKFCPHCGKAIHPDAGATPVTSDQV